MMAHDTFCWKCCGSNATLNCSRCVRSWHNNCAIKQEDIDDFEQANWVCLVCSELQLCDDTPNMLLALPTLMNKIRNKKWCPDRRHSVHNRTILIVNPIDLTKKDWKTYTNLREFYGDVEWIVHNYTISIANDKPNQINKAQSLLKNVRDDIAEIRTCAECYIRKNKKRKTWFKCLCNDLHLIVWAKRGRLSYWPVKLFSIDEEQMVKAQCFGDHSILAVPASKCYLYSKVCPDPPKGDLRTHKNAVKEALDYIKNIESKFGQFKYAHAKTKLDPTQLNEYVEQMIPGMAAIRQSVLNEIEKAANIDENFDSSVDNLVARISTIMPGRNSRAFSAPMVHDYIKPMLSEKRVDGRPIREPMCVIPRLLGIMGSISAMQDSDSEDDGSESSKRSRTESPIPDEHKFFPENHDITQPSTNETTIQLSEDTQKIVDEFQKNQKDEINTLVARLQEENGMKVESLNDEVKSLKDKMSNLEGENLRQQTEISNHLVAIQELKQKHEHLKRKFQSLIENDF